MSRGKQAMSNMLQQISNEMAQMVESVGETIVRVEARRRLPASGFVWSEDLIVTSHHVIERDQVVVGLGDGRTTEAKLVGRDPSTDVAILRVPSGFKLPAPRWVDAQDGPDALKVGHLVLALGRPMRHVQAALGVVSTIGAALAEEDDEKPKNDDSGRRARRWAERASRLDAFIQTDVVMYPGFSGGPLVDAAGRIHGFNSSGFMRGISITIPNSMVKVVGEQLLRHGKVRQGYLGVGVQPARLSAAMAKTLNQAVGLLVVSVEADSPADHANIMLGDVLVGLNGQAVESLEALQAQLRGDAIGHEGKAQIIRGGQVMELAVMVGERK
jgi:S1-C subfamily serine protease